MKKVIPMAVKDGVDPCVFNPNTGEFEMTNHVVQFTESERGWGGEIWYSSYDSEQEALKEVRECNKDLPAMTPNYYIIAKYLGVMDVVPKGYKI